MKKSILVASILGLLLFYSVAADASDQNLPIINGKKAVATVDGEPITLDEFNKAIEAIHAEVTEGKMPGKRDFPLLLERLINRKLILIEAREMGLDELPETETMVKKYSDDSLIRLLLSQQVRDVEPDMAEVDELYKEAVKEFKVTSLNFEKDDDAKRMVEEVEGGADFDEQAKKYVREGRAKWNSEGEFLKKNALLPHVADALSKMEAGSVSPVIPLGSAFTVIRLDDVRTPENTEARMQAIKKVTKMAKEEAVGEFYEDLKKRYVKTDEELLESLDYESENPGLESLLKDSRIISVVAGEEPVTVGVLSEKLKENFYHGFEGALEKKRVNKRKKDVLENILEERVFEKEALRLGIDGTDRYTTMVEEYENNLMFETFIQKIIAPGIKLNIEELKEYYDKHTDEFRSPELMRIKSIAFEERIDAEKAIDKLRGGTAYSWLTSNAEGQVESDREGLLLFNGAPILTTSLAEDVRKAVKGAKTGDFRLYQSPEDIYYLLFIQEVFPPTTKPFESVRKDIAREVFNRKLAKEVEGYADKLREVYEVKIYAPDLERK
jgi:Skp family chaperone for outer membrane proteins